MLSSFYDYRFYLMSIVVAFIYIKIRNKFDHDKSPSIVHSTDNEIETWDYINCCFPGMEKEIKKSIQKLEEKKIFLPFYLKFTKFLPYYKASLNSKIKSWILNMVTK